MDKNIKAVLGILGLLVIALISGVVIYHSITGLSIGGNASVNATISSTSYNSIGDLFLAVLLTVIAAVIIVVLYTLAYNFKGFDRLSGIWRFIALSGYYFLWGSALLIIVAGPLFSAYYTWEYMSANPGTAGSLFEVLKVIVILLGVFFGVALLGKYIGEPVLRRIQENYKKHKEMKT